MFHVSTLIPCGEDSLEKRRLTDYAYVKVVWTEDIENFVPDFKGSQTVSMQIVIYPMQSGLFHIRIFQKMDRVCFDLLLCYFY